VLTERLTMLRQLAEATPYFNVARIIGADPNSIDSDISQAIGRLKLAMEFQMLGAGTSSNSTNFAQFDEIFPVVLFYENRKLNDTGISSLMLAEQWAALIKAQDGWLVADVVPIDLAEGLCIEYAPEEDWVIHAVRMHTQGTVDEVEIDQVATPVITETAGNITITCATGPAAIYYTLDGSAPRHGNPEAIHYTGLFAPDAGLQIRAQGWAMGYLASEIAELESTAGGGSGINDEFVNLTQFRALWNAQSGNLKFSANGDLILQTREETVGDRTLHQVHVTKTAVGQPVSVVADDAEATLP
jgi:hypothetical protein